MQVVFGAPVLQADRSLAFHPRSYHGLEPAELRRGGGGPWRGLEQGATGSEGPSFKRTRSTPPFKKDGVNTKHRIRIGHSKGVQNAVSTFEWSSTMAHFLMIQNSRTSESPRLPHVPPLHEFLRSDFQLKTGRKQPLLRHGRLLPMLLACAVLGLLAYSKTQPSGRSGPPQEGCSEQTRALQPAMEILPLSGP